MGNLIVLRFEYLETLVLFCYDTQGRSSRNANNNNKTMEVNPHNSVEKNNESLESLVG